PSTEYSIVINADNQRPYLQHSNCDHKIEITSALLNDMTKSYEAVDRNYQAIDQSNLISSEGQYQMALNELVDGWI
ncbi:25742_t:CDS:2, partial [Gigaspora rosea]